MTHSFEGFRKAIPWISHLKSYGKRESTDSSWIADELKIYQLKQARKQVIHIDEVRREAARQAEMFQTELRKLPGKIESQLPDCLDAAVVAVICETVTESVGVACQIAGELGKGVLGLAEAD